MATDIVMPRLSDSMEEGTVLTWMKSVGDEVALGEELVEIETDKANMVYESDAAGTLIEIVADEGDTLPIGEVIARVGEPAEAAAGGERAAAGRARRSIRAPLRIVLRTLAAPAGAARRPRPRRPPRPTQQRRDWSGTAVKASPLARRIARRRASTSASLQGSGPGRADHQGGRRGGATAARRRAAAPRPRRRAARRPPGAAREARDREGVGRGRRADASSSRRSRRRMAESKATAPHFYLQAEIDMTAAWEARARIKASARRGRGGAVVQRHGGEGVRDRAARVPARQRRLPRRQVGALLAGQRRDRGRRPGRARRADDLRRRPQGPAADRHRGAGAGGAGARGHDHPARALGRHVHRLQPRHVRDLELPRRDQLAAGRRSSPSARSPRRRSSATARSRPRG